MLLAQMAVRADALARASAGNSRLARIAMTAITTSNSISVKAVRSTLNRQKGSRCECIGWSSEDHTRKTIRNQAADWGWRIQMPPFRKAPALSAVVPDYDVPRVVDFNRG